MRQEDNGFKDHWEDVMHSTLTNTNDKRVSMSKYLHELVDKLEIAEANWSPWKHIGELKGEIRSVIGDTKSCVHEDQALVAEALRAQCSEVHHRNQTLEAEHLKFQEIELKLQEAQYRAAALEEERGALQATLQAQLAQLSSRGQATESSVAAAAQALSKV